MGPAVFDVQALLFLLLCSGNESMGASSMTKDLDRLGRCASGASSAEYALILGLLMIAIIGGGTALGTAVNFQLDNVSQVLTP
ncbi:Flp family type IVb pilin [Sandarakinorhabdus glacialis]|uniref:Flp family type IVb pilin n=1 Tax=Sandarakinorhabdus glacialis TaxID=1614636 RepID=UPI001A9C9259|nr:Flp family type IVb pilin [Polymorphobacter glacialis]